MAKSTEVSTNLPLVDHSPSSPLNYPSSPPSFCSSSSSSSFSSSSLPSSSFSSISLNVNLNLNLFPRHLLISNKVPISHPPSDRIYDHSFYMNVFSRKMMNNRQGERYPPNCYRYYDDEKKGIHIKCGHHNTVWNGRGIPKNDENEENDEGRGEAKKKRGRKRKEPFFGTNILPDSSIPNPLDVKQKRRVRCQCRQIDCYLCGVCQGVPVIDLQLNSKEHFDISDCVCEICNCNCSKEWTSGNERKLLMEEINKIDTERNGKNRKEHDEKIKKSQEQVEIFNQIIAAAPTALQQKLKKSITFAPPNVVSDELKQTDQMVADVFSSALSSSAADPFDGIIQYLCELRSKEKIDEMEYEKAMKLVENENKHLLRLRRVFKNNDDEFVKNLKISIQK